jgi:hypothetical protein
VRIAITGGRDHRPTRDEMLRFEELWEMYHCAGDELIHGACPTGVDALVSWYAEVRLGIEPIPMAADWKRHGRAAGPIRNGEMMATAGLLIAFPGGSGTADCVRQAKAKGIPVRFVRD